MKKSTKLTTAFGAVALAGALAFGVSGIVDAGHGGALTEGDFDGFQEVDPTAKKGSRVGDFNGRGEAYVFSPGGSTVCYILDDIDKIDPATAAHIHAAPAGQNGPVVVALSAPTNGSSAGCVDVGDSELAADITLRDSANFYVNIHNERYPAGAIRAQLGN